MVTHPSTKPARPDLTSELVCLRSLFLTKLFSQTLPSPPPYFLLSVFSLYPRFASYCEYRISSYGKELDVRDLTCTHALRLDKVKRLLVSSKYASEKFELLRRRKVEFTALWQTMRNSHKVLFARNNLAQ